MKKTCAPLEWEDITGGDLLSTVQSESPAAKFMASVREDRQSCSLCAEYSLQYIFWSQKYGQQEFCQWVQWGKDFSLGQQQQLQPTTLLLWSGVSLDLPMELCKDRGGWQTHLMSYISIQSATSEIHHIVLREGFFTEKQILKCVRVCQYFLLID